jgi:putative endonuclease
MEYITYILYSKLYNKHYIGQTNNLKIRLIQHADGRKSWTNKYKPWTVIYQNAHQTRAEAMKEEKHLKSLKNKERIREYIKKYSAG